MSKFAIYAGPKGKNHLGAPSVLKLWLAPVSASEIEHWKREAKAQGFSVFAVVEINEEAQSQDAR